MVVEKRPAIVPVPRLTRPEELSTWAGQAVAAVEQVNKQARDAEISLDGRVTKLERADGRVADIFSNLEIHKSTLSTQFFIYTESASVTVILPPFETCPGRVFGFKKMVAANSVILKVGSGLVEGAASLTFSTQYEARTLQSDGRTGWWIV